MSPPNNGRGTPPWAVREKPKNLRKAMGDLLGYIGKYRFSILLGVALSVIGAILSLIGPQYVEAIANTIQDGIGPGKTIDTARILVLAATAIGLYALGVVFSTSEHYIISSTSEKIANLLRRDLSHKIDRIPLGYYDNSSTGDIMSRLTNDADTIGESCSQSISMLITSLTTIVGAAVMMFYTNATLASVAIIPSLFGFVLMFTIMKRSQKYFRRQTRDLGAMNGLVEEVYYGHDIVMAYNGEESASKRFEHINDDLYTSSYRARFISSTMPQMMNFINNLGYVIVCIFGSMMVIEGSIGYGVIVAFIIYVRQFTQPMNPLSDSLVSMQSVAAASERVFELLNAEEMEDESHKDTVLPDIKGRVEFDHIRFGYLPGKTIIDDFSLTVEPGMKIAIVGPTGAGKTTIVNLLMRFYEIDEGEIRIDGIPTSSMTRSQVHSLFSMVLQDSWLFNGTIRENIRYNKEDMSDEKIEEACKAVGIHEFISGLPDGYGSVIGDRSNMSSGQRQQLTIARAVARDAPLIILDEATSSVDTRTEKIIQDAMDRLTAGRTSFVIAHRLSTIRNADIILVIKEGHIVEKGNHHELLALNGFYKELYDSQFENCD
ncbi:MAG: ABC transporter ATP-binding protein/permease [archaeon]|nr:ABC transporter ATP-binding protein/permease [archaeon]